MATLTMRNLSKWYGEVIGVSDISTEIAPGVTGLLGPNGAGKTTLFKLLTGLSQPDTGVAQLNGKNIFGNHALYLQIGFCPASERMYDHLSGMEFLTYMGRLSGMSRTHARERASQALNEMGLADAAHKRIGAYSKGMRQRVKFAQSILHDPDVLFFDEPLSGMDPVGRQHSVEMVRRYGEQGKTVVVSSHILHEVEEMTNRIMLLNNGMLLAEGLVPEIRELLEEQPRHVQITTRDRRQLSNHLVQFPEVQTIRFGDKPDELIVQTLAPDGFYPRLTETALQEDIVIDELVTLDDNLQSIFDYLVRQ